MEGSSLKAARASSRAWHTTTLAASMDVLPSYNRAYYALEHASIVAHGIRGLHGHAASEDNLGEKNNSSSEDVYGTSAPKPRKKCRPASCETPPACSRPRHTQCVRSCCAARAGLVFGSTVPKLTPSSTDHERRKALPRHRPSATLQPRGSSIEPNWENTIP